MKLHLAVLASSVLFAVTIASGCEDSSDGGSTSGGFDAGGFDGNTQAGDALPPGDSSTTDDGGGDASADGGVTPPPPTPNDVYVDPTAGLDTNTGKSGSPFKTITKAFSVVPAGAGVHLLDGAYTFTTEGTTDPLTIPVGVNVRSENPGMAKLTLILQTSMSGAAAIYDVVFLDNSLVNARGTATLVGSNLHFLPNGHNTVNVSDSAAATLVGGILDGQGGGEPVIGDGLLYVHGTGSLTLDGFTMQNTTSPGVLLSGTSPTMKAAFVMKNNSVFDTIGVSDTHCEGNSAINPGSNGTILIDHSTIKNAPTAGICVGDNIDITIQNGSTFLKDGDGIRAQDGVLTTASLKVRSSTFTNNIRGIAWLTTGNVDVSDATITTTLVTVYQTSGIELLAGGAGISAIVRKTTVHGYDYAIYASTGAAPFTADLGTGASPGMNDFSQSVMSGLYDRLPAGAVLDAQGNTWNAGVQGADAAGHYTAGTTALSPASGTNYIIDNAATLDL